MIVQPKAIWRRDKIRCAILKCIGIGLVLFFLLISACANKKGETQTMVVTATAYNSVSSQTKATNPSIAAWGDELKPGMKCIAVSRDLIALGLKHNTEVKIEGLDGTFIVLDKMHRRKKKSIDIYMGLDLTAAKKWGRKKVTISWQVDSIN